MIDLNKSKGAVANAVGPLLGTATGGIGSGLLAQYLPVPTHLVYLALFGIFIIQAIGVTLMRESSSPRPGALASLRHRSGQQHRSASDRRQGELRLAALALLGVLRPTRATVPAPRPLG